MQVPDEILLRGATRCLDLNEAVRKIVAADQQIGRLGAELRVEVDGAQAGSVQHRGNRAYQFGTAAVEQPVPHRLGSLLGLAQLFLNTQLLLGVPRLKFG